MATHTQTIAITAVSWPLSRTTEVSRHQMDGWIDPSIHPSMDGWMDRSIDNVDLYSTLS